MKVLTEDDFNPKKRVENYRLYLKAEGLKIGDKANPHDYQIWISKRVREFREINNLSEWTSMESFDYEKYMDYLRTYAGDVHKQISLF